MSQLAKREDMCLPVLVHLVKRDEYLHSSRVRDDKKTSWVAHHTSTMDPRDHTTFRFEGEVAVPV